MGFVVGARGLGGFGGLGRLRLRRGVLGERGGAGEHAQGERVLDGDAQRAGAMAAVRGIDKVVRFGGDEFCVILPQTDQDQAIMVANRIARAISSQPLHIEKDLDVTITASFGIATYPTHAMTKDGLIRQADAAMYRVKSTTKNAVGVAIVEDATRPV